jgi:flagellar assembly protein FliH
MQEEVQAREDAAFQRGLSAGAQQERIRVDPVLARLARTIADLGEARTKALMEADHDIVQLAIAVARRILRRELTVDPDSLAGIVKAALERIATRETQRVRVNPEDAGCIERHLQSAGTPPRIEVCADSSLERGSVIFETARGNLDASVSTQLTEIERGLTDMLRRRNS